MATNLALRARLTRLHARSRGTYGAPRLTAELRDEGYPCGRHRVARLMRAEGIVGCARKKWRPIGLTDSRHELPIAPRVFQVEEPRTHPTAPNQLWVSDTTYVPTQEGWLYLTVHLDVFTRKVVGYSLANHLRAEAVCASLRMALQRQTQALRADTPEPLVTHSDRGRQYASDLYRGKLARLGITASMSRRGNCYDNAFAETFFHTLKVELIHRQQYRTRQQAQAAIESYIDEWYNPYRRHSGLGYQAPNTYERRASAA